MSGRKQKTNKSAEKRAPKYASKQVDLVLDKLIEQRIQTSKYPQKVIRSLYLFYLHCVHSLICAIFSWLDADVEMDGQDAE
jgi:hypothetical protein